MVDFFLLLMLAGAGDELQGIKKGIMEMADVLVINKADGENVEPAKKAKVAYENALHLFPLAEKNWSPKVQLASSTTGSGLPEVWEIVRNYENQMKGNGFWESNRADQRLNWLDDQIQFLLGQAFLKDSVIQKMLESRKPKVQKGELNPSKLAKSLIQLFFQK